MVGDLEDEEAVGVEDEEDKDEARFDDLVTCARFSRLVLLACVADHSAVATDGTLLAIIHLRLLVALGVSVLS